MNRLKIFLPIALVIFSISLQANNGGSIYTRYGLGDLRYFPSGRSAGFGGAGISVLSNYAINRINPAAWTGLHKTRYEISGMYEGIFTSDEFNSAYFAKMTFEGFMISFPVLPSRGVTLTAGMYPYSRVRYEVTTPKKIESLEFDNRYIGTGGISTANIGSSIIFGSDLHIGLKLDYYFGSVTYTTKQNFSGASYTSAEVERSIYMHGIGYTIGGIYSGIGDIFNLPKTSSLSLGFIFSPKTNLKPTEEKYYTYNNQIVRSHDTLITEKEKINFPFTLGGGIAFSSEEWVIASDIFFQEWEKTTITESTDLKNVLRIALGAEFLGKRDPAVSISRRTAYRCGVYYNSTYYKIKNNTIDEFGFTAGIGFPILGDTRIDLGIDFSLRGTTKDQLQRDNILRFTISLAGGESWFTRPVQD